MSVRLYSREGYKIYDSVTDALHQCHVLNIDVSDCKEFVSLEENNDAWYFLNLRKDDLAVFIQELQAIHDGMIDRRTLFLGE